MNEHSSNLKISFGFIFQNENNSTEVVKDVLKLLNKQVHSAINFNMEVFNHERKKNLDRIFKQSHEETVERNALRAERNYSKNGESAYYRFESTELWKVRKITQSFQDSIGFGEFHSKKTKGRKGLIYNTERIMNFDREKYEEQMTELKKNPEKLEYIRTTHVPSDEDKLLLIKQYLKNERRKSNMEQIDSSMSAYYINQDNRKYNEKLDRAYHEYTADIKQNLERGTAL
ncbi:pre-mRNA-splicing factor SYF2 [Cryptosporidium felis]|nr:pre-mRNA-splicing factor SYF2 [Cryptosporidium felis]